MRKSLSIHLGSCLQPWQVYVPEARGMFFSWSTWEKASMIAFVPRNNQFRLTLLLFPSLSLVCVGERDYLRTIAHRRGKQQ